MDSLKEVAAQATKTPWALHSTLGKNLIMQGDDLSLDAQSSNSHCTGMMVGHQIHSLEPSEKMWSCSSRTRSER